MSTENIKTIEEEFLSQKDKCPFCDAELSEITISKSLSDQKTCTIYDYGCQLQIRKDEELLLHHKGKMMIRITSIQCCSNRTAALETVLRLKQQLNQK